jgi:TniQ
MLLPAALPPIPGESLNGFLLRLSELNGYASLAQLHKVAGYCGTPLRYMPGIGDRLAPLLGMAPDEIKALSYERGSTAAVRVKAHICGHDVQPAMVDANAPKICPACIVERGYIQAFWDLTPLVSCPVHRTLLLTTCPSCRRPLTWLRPGLLTCNCEVDWRNAVPPAPDEMVVAMTEMIAARFQGRDADTTAAAYFPPELAGLTLNDLLLVVATFSWWSAGRVGTGLKEFHSMTAPERVSLVTAGVRVFTGWPHRFWAFLDDVRGRMPHEGEIGHPLRKEMGNLRALLVQNFTGPEGAFLRNAVIEWRDRTWPTVKAGTKRTRAEMSPEERELSEWRVTGSRTGIGPSAARKTAKAMGLSQAEVAALASSLAECIGINEGAAHLGMSVKTLRSFVNAGLVPFDTNLIDDGRRDRTFLIRDLDAFIERFRRIARPVRLAPESTQIRQISEGFRLFSSAEWPVNEIMQRMEDGQVPVWHDGEVAPKILNEFRVDLNDVRHALRDWIEATNPGWITVTSAAERLGICSEAVLSRADKGRMPSHAYPVNALTHNM